MDGVYGWGLWMGSMDEVYGHLMSILLVGELWVGDIYG